MVKELKSKLTPAYTISKYLTSIIIGYLKTEATTNIQLSNLLF